MGKVAAAQAPMDERPHEAEPHLREVLESHPVAFVRLDGDGTLLAVNEQGLNLLGARSLEEVLGSSLIGLVTAQERKGCQSLFVRAIKGEWGSLEVDLISLTGTLHTFELRAVAYPAAPDGVPSALVSLRDVTDTRRLAQSLVEAVAAQGELGLAHATERSRLLADLEQARQAQSHQSESAAQLTELDQRLAALNEERSALETAHDAEIARLRESHAEEGRQFAAETAAAVATLEAANQERAQLQARCEALESERGQLVEESDRLRAATEARQSSVDALTGQLAALDVDRQAALAAATDLRRTLDEQQAQTAALASHVEAVDAELTTLRQAAEAEKAAIRADSDSSLRTLEARYTTDTDVLRNALNDAMDEQARLAQAVARAEEDAARTAAQVEVFERAIAEQDVRHEARVREIESGHREQRAEIEATNAAHLLEAEAAAATRLQEAEARLAEATARADDAVAAIQRAETEFASQRQRLEEALAASVEAERLAQSTLTAEIATRSLAERTRESLLQAIGRLAEDARQYGESASAASRGVDA
jgi:PAS domain S-box-containing protein